MKDIKDMAVDKIVKEGKEIWLKSGKFRTEHKSMKKEDYETLHKKIIEEHKEFASIYAIVVRSIVYQNIYYENVMHKYVKHLANHPWNSRGEFLDRQADYLVYLRREVEPRSGSKDIAIYRDHIRKQLHEEDKDFMDKAEDMKKIIDAEISEKMEDRKQRIYECLTANTNLPN